MALLILSAVLVVIVLIALDLAVYIRDGNDKIKLTDEEINDCFKDVDKWKS